MSNPVSFNNLEGVFDVVDTLRRRYQMYVNDAAELHGLLLGYALARGDGFEYLPDDFKAFVRKRLANDDPRHGWSDKIRLAARGREYEVSLALDIFDEYRGTIHPVLAQVDLQFEHRHFDFHRRSSKQDIDYPWPILRPPHAFRVVMVESVGVCAFFLDAQGVKFYEQCFPSLESVLKWAKDCYGLDAADWTICAQHG